MARQVKVVSSVYNPKTGETIQTFEQSKTHKRKHQINTLAQQVCMCAGAAVQDTETALSNVCWLLSQQAAERELEILEGKHKAMLTKAQTQSKYGW